MALVISPEMFRGKIVRASGWRTPVSQGLANASHTVQVNLLTSTYVTGGFALTPGVTGLAHVTNVKQLVGYDPYGRLITVQPTLTFELVMTDSTRPLLKMYVSGVEAANASTRAGSVWLELMGRNA